MASEILENNIADNSIISADTLNNIAIDLGKDDFSAFSDGVAYAVDKLNLITAELAGPGIIPKIKNEMAVSISDGKITVSEGVGIFSNGMKARLETPKELDFSGSETYIYIKYDSLTNIMTLNASDTEPDCEYLLDLAKISAEGKVYDRRFFSQGKCSPTTANFTESHTISAEYTLTSDEYIHVDTINLAFSGYRGFILTSDTLWPYSTAFGTYSQSGEESKYLWVSGEGYIYRQSDYFVADTGSAGFNSVYLKFKISGDRLEVYLKKSAERYPLNVNVNVKVEMF
ncbi:MAG: hypothetical protein IJC74_02330 [Clostridia bacterium]|nr:hypothetical protein [Clostridia bacterium]